VTSALAEASVPTTAATPLLRVANVGVRFGGIVALERVSFDLHAGQMLGLIGPNGAGKTTLFNCFSRLYTPVEGDILFEGASILDKPPHRMVEIGIGRTFQNLALFARMSVLDNVRVGGHRLARSDFFSDALHLPWVTRQDRAVDETVWELIDYLDLHAVAHRPVADLPFGLQKRVELARALATRPRVLLLDEWLSGLSPGELEGGMSVVWSLAAQGMAVILVEHVMTAVRALCSRVVVMNAGSKIAEGPPVDVLRNPEVVRAYLGDDDA